MGIENWNRIIYAIRSASEIIKKSATISTARKIPHCNLRSRDCGLTNAFIEFLLMDITFVLESVVCMLVCCEYACPFEVRLQCNKRNVEIVVTITKCIGPPTPNYAVAKVTFGYTSKILSKPNKWITRRTSLDVFTIRKAPW